MAKIRVYELARELNLNNKDLLQRLKEMDIPVGSHMSSLDTDTVAKVKEGLTGKKVEPEVVSTRVKPTVIRRRKKKVVKKAEPEEKPATLEAEEPPVETAAETEPAAESVEAEPEVQAEVPSEETVEPEAQAVPEKEVPPAEIEKTAPAGDELAETAPVESAERVEKPEAPESKPAVEEKPEKAAKKEAKKKAAKKKPRTGVAKIIKLPEKPPELPAKRRKAAPGSAPAPRRPSDVTRPEPSPGKESKKKKGKRYADRDGLDKKPFRKKPSFRRKEIVEGAALYDGKRMKGRKGKKGAAARSGKQQKTLVTVPKAIKRKIKIDDTIMLSELAKRMGIKAGEMIQKLMGLGVMATVNQTIDFDTAALVASEFEYEVEKASFEEELLIQKVADDPEKLVGRPPVVTIMGHVDHGKTSLLDVIRKTHITDDEAGGITQHIGAYNVTTEKGQVAFLDTPGHEAFTAMRSRGAKITDIVVLVVAADDGVMPQTIEAINHSRAAEVPIVVAVNKMDKADADPDRVKRELSEHGIVSEEWGGDAIFVNVSAKQKTGIDDLLDMILLQSEVLELKANPEKLAEGHVVESKLDAGRGPVATVLIQDGTLTVGESVVCGVHYGKIRAMLGDTGNAVQSAGPSVPVEVLGLTGVPEAGDELIALKDEKNAKQISQHRMQKQRSLELAKTSRLSLDKLFENLKTGEVKDLNLILKADVHGSIEAIKDALTKLSNEEVNINIVHAATGTVTESDISLAAVSEAIIIGFNVRPSAKVAEMAKEENIDMRFYNIIYNLIKDIKDAIVGMMSSTFEERTLGMAEVREVFQIPKVGAVAGCYVTDGTIQRSQFVRLVREGIVTFEGKLASLRRFKDDVREVQSGYECGIGIERYNDIKIGDVIECYTLDEIKPELE